jgi:hypothetical protein
LRDSNNSYLNFMKSSVQSVPDLTLHIKLNNKQAIQEPLPMRQPSARIISKTTVVN